MGGMFIRNCGHDDEPLCETSEKGERHFSRDEMLLTALDIGRRILEIFGYRDLSEIVFRLRSNRYEIDSIINGETLPSTEILLAIHKTTGASIDWLLTGEGAKYSSAIHQPAIEKRRVSLAQFPLRRRAVPTLKTSKPFALRK